MKKTKINPFQKRIDTLRHLDQVVYVNRAKFPLEDDSMIHVYAIEKVLLHPGGKKQIKELAFSRSFHWNVITIESGAGVFIHNKVKTAIRRGDVIIIRPGIGFTVYADQNSKIRLYNLLLHATFISEIICGRCQIQPLRIVHVSDCTRLYNIMQQFINSADNSEINPRETLSIAAYTFLYQVNSHDFKRKELDQFSNIVCSIRMAPELYCSVGDLAREFGLSEYSLFSLFKKRLGISPIKFIISERLEKSRWYLIRQNLPISAIAQLCGYHNIPLFSRQFKQFFGLTPQNYRNQYKKSGDSSIPAESKKAAEKT